MKKLSLLLALMALLFTDLAAAAGAVVSSLTGTVQAQTGSAAPRVLRQGDQVVQGDTVSTGPRSSVVLKFDDGQIAALTADSRMQVTAYTYNPQAQSGNVLLSLVVGGMRAITGLIGHNNTQNVGYRAATATIGIRGSNIDLFFQIPANNSAPNFGAFANQNGFVFSDPTLAPGGIEIGEGNGVSSIGGTLHQGPMSSLNLTPEINGLLDGLSGLSGAIGNALGQAATGTNLGTGTPNNTGTVGSSSGGGGSNGCSNGANNPPTCQ